VVDVILFAVVHLIQLLVVVTVIPLVVDFQEHLVHLLAVVVLMKFLLKSQVLLVVLVM
jgi:hypothetical protein